MIPHSLYLHIPFCVHRCAYCDFNTYAGLEELIPAYAAALVTELGWGPGHASAEGVMGGRLPVHTLFFGGGTPSLLPLEQLEQILTAIHTFYAISPQAEQSLEANPGTLSPAYLHGLRQMGINRLSLGVQSANPFELHLLERQHDYPAVIQSVTWARQAGFDNLNLDLIFGLPGQEMNTWQNTLRLVCDLEPEHLSLYALTLEHGTPMQHWVARGLMSDPDADTAADMYEWASDYLDGRGYQQYEISNWARPDVGGVLQACRHNLQYWRGLPYLGFGAGAHGYAAGIRTANVLAPHTYIQRLAAFQPNADAAIFPRTPATASATGVGRQAEMGELMMMGLRLTREGVSGLVFQQRFGEALDQVYGKPIRQLVGQGLLEQVGQSIRLTERGRLLGNRVFMEFV